MASGRCGGGERRPIGFLCVECRAGAIAVPGSGTRGGLGFRVGGAFRVLGFWCVAGSVCREEGAASGSAQGF
jgi:hypothetical protein